MPLQTRTVQVTHGVHVTGQMLYIKIQHLIN